MYLVGSDRISSELHAISRAANAALARPMTLDYEFNDPSDAESLYTRSDHYSYASKGIPVIFFTTGLHPDYHANTDEVSKIEFDKMTRVVELRLRNRRPAREPRPRAGARQQGRARREVAHHPVTRPLLVIFLTIFVNLIGFGIIIPLLPFYAETFGASPIVIGLLFAVFSICQLIAAPMLGDWSDRYGRRPILIFSLLGTVVELRDARAGAQHRDAVRRENRRRPVGRQHLDRPRLRRRRHRAEGSRPRLRADRRWRSASGSSSVRRSAACW